MRYYSAYGHTLYTAEDFDGLLAAGESPADFRYTVSREEPPAGPASAGAAYQSVERDATGVPYLQVWRQGDRYRLRRWSVGVYDLTPSSIVCYPRADAIDEMPRIHLLGSVMSLRLEAAGTPALHASAVIVDDRAVGFLSNSGSGKSTLAAALIQAGCPMLTDDVLPVEARGREFMGRSGYPQVRLWPEEAEYYCGPYENLARVHSRIAKRRVPVGEGGFGVFCATARPLACLYRPERRQASDPSSTIEISPEPARDAMIELVRHSFLAPVVQALGWQAQRLEFFASLVQQVPVRRLVYPGTRQHLPAVREAILADVASLRSTAGSVTC